MKKAQMKFMMLITGLLASSMSLAEYGLNLRKGVTEFSETAYGMHTFTLWICIVIGIVVFGAMIYSIFAHRKSKGFKPDTFTHSTTAEVIWTIIPILILVVIAIPATKALIQMENPMDDDGKRMSMDMTIKVTGYQWKWKYDYMEEGISILSTLAKESNVARQKGSGIDPNTVENYLLDVDNPLVIPANTNIRFLLTADDVIHAWWVPDFGWKRDAIPGYINEGWTNVKTPGTYRGQCAELCGKDHGFMPIVVEVLSKADYANWVAEQKGVQQEEAEMVQTEWSKEQLMAKGEEVYNTQCATCHLPTGAGMPPAFPALAGSEFVNGPAEAQIDLVLNGKPGTAMQAFGKLLSETDIAAAITYTRNSFGNTAGDVVQPAQVKSMKQ
ncbi:cytochrome c oxidase subunit II [Marinicella litoralis]|uniref:Cytochrome c oxidase subunit 2 n=1 Tax=Marinicella litoralis TaxID=644220 RepID=A0A4R6XRN0_9GAMM|nr:cytochrome c oxidase subunit II [Marinicella litoralis]TDR20567.1 cytochrome c oxidase subunit 2 [Marinicella litoralis]